MQKAYKLPLVYSKIARMFFLKQDNISNFSHSYNISVHNFAITKDCVDVVVDWMLYFKCESASIIHFLGCMD